MTDPDEKAVLDELEAARHAVQEANVRAILTHFASDAVDDLKNAKARVEAAQAQAQRIGGVRQPGIRS